MTESDLIAEYLRTKHGYLKDISNHQHVSPPTDDKGWVLFSYQSWNSKDVCQCLIEYNTYWNEEESHVWRVNITSINHRDYDYFIRCPISDPQFFQELDNIIVKGKSLCRGC